MQFAQCAALIGLALLATVTSLPELLTGISSVIVAHAPNLAVGDALGSCVVNLVFLVVIDFFLRKKPVWQCAARGHLLAASFGAVMLGVVLAGLLVSQLSFGLVSGLSTTTAHWGFSQVTSALLALYLAAMRTVFAYERDHAVCDGDGGEDTSPSLRSAVIRFTLAVAVVAAAGVWLPFVATDLAQAMIWNKSFVGSLFVAMATSLPELAFTLAALPMGALDVAIGNLRGSNLFNVLIIAVDNLFCRAGEVLADVSAAHVVTVASAITMTGLAMVGLLFQAGLARATACQLGQPRFGCHVQPQNLGVVFAWRMRQLIPFINWSPAYHHQHSLGAMRIKLTNMLSIFADSLGQQASRFEPVLGHGCSPKANLIFQLVWENA